MFDLNQVGKSPAMQKLLYEVHKLRMQAHWGKNAELGPWPQTEAEWRQTSHGAPWDTNVHMAIWHYKLAGEINKL